MAAAKPKKPAPKKKPATPAAKGTAAPKKRAVVTEAAPSTFRPFEALGALKKKTAPKKAKPEPKAARRADDGAVFAAAMRGVKPLDPGQIRVVAAPEARSEEDEAAAATLRSLVLDGLTFEVIDDGETLQGRRIDVDPREVRRLRQQHYTIEGTLDLHKHSVAEARVAVVAFVARRSREGDKCVAIVHGKGKHSVDGQSVLRGELGAWLSQGDAAKHVLAFTSILDRAGESGRLLVRLG